MYGELFSMLKIINLFLTLQFILALLLPTLTHAEAMNCDQYLTVQEPLATFRSQESSAIVQPEKPPATVRSQEVSASAPSTESSILSRLYSSLPGRVVKPILKTMAYFKGLPRYFKKIEQLRQSGDYLKYDNFGEMGLAEIGISLRYNQAKLEGLNTGRPLVILGNHHLGIADGLAIQYLSGQARANSPSLLFLARWIEKLLPHAVYGDEHQWGTAIPVDINTPKASDPDFAAKTADINKFNSSWSRTSLKALRQGAALIIFPAGHVAGINQGAGQYPENIYDSPHSWQEGFLNLARFAKADIVFANIVSVNSEAFYKNRKRFGGGDLERVIWFFSEALAKKDQVMDIELSKPMDLDAIYDRLAEVFKYPKETLINDQALTAELMRQYTYNLSVFEPQTLDTLDSPLRK